jgi:hypothetical protein
LATAAAHAERGHDLGLLRAIKGVLAEQDLLAGHAAAARAQLLPVLDQADHEELDVTELLPLLAWAALECGDSAEAEALLSACVRRAQYQEALTVVPDALRVRARLERRRGCWGAAEQALEEALVLSRSLPYPYAEVKALFEYGHLQLQQGMAQQARERFEAALAICARLGEQLYAQHIEAMLALTT